MRWAGHVVCMKVKLKSKVHPITGYEDPEGGVDIYLYSLLNLGARWVWMVSATPRPLYPRERETVPIV